MTAAQMATRLELERSMRDRDPSGAVAFRLLDASGYHSRLDGQCFCGRLLGPGELEQCADCEVVR